MIAVAVVTVGLGAFDRGTRAMRRIRLSTQILLIVEVMRCSP
jgi:hypothetical protein